MKLEEVIRWTIRPGNRKEYYCKRKCYTQEMYLKLEDSHLMWWELKNTGKLKQYFTENDWINGSLVPLTAQEILATDWEIYLYTSEEELLEMKERVLAQMSDTRGLKIDSIVTPYMTKLKTIDDLVAEAEGR